MKGTGRLCVIDLEEKSAQKLTSSSSQSFSDLRAYSIFLTLGVCFFFACCAAGVGAPKGAAPGTPATVVEAGANELAGMSVGFVRCRQTGASLLALRWLRCTHLEVV